MPIIVLITIIEVNKSKVKHKNFVCCNRYEIFLKIQLKIKSNNL